MEVSASRKEEYKEYLDKNAIRKVTRRFEIRQREARDWGEVEMGLL